MLCKSCRVAFPFYLKYCRQCGGKLFKEIRNKTNTHQMASLIKHADLGDGKKYSTSPMTQQMGQSANSVVELLQNILEEFPSLDTTEIPKVFPSLYVYQRKMSKTEQMRQTLREFDMSELQELEDDNTLFSRLEANANQKFVTNKMIETSGTQTMEFKRPSTHIGGTLQFVSNSSSTTTNRTKLVLGSDRLAPTRTLPTKLYLPSSENMVKVNSQKLPSNSFAGVFRQTLSNLWIRMRDLAENLSFNLSLKKNA